MKTFLSILSLLLIVASANAQTGNVGIGTPTPSDQLHTTGTVRFQKYSGVGRRLVYLDSTGRITMPEPLYRNSAPAAIPDNGCTAGTGVTQTIVVSGAPASVVCTAIAVRVNIVHPFCEDLDVFLIAPNGDKVLLASDVGSSGDNFINTVFSDLATAGIASGSAPFTGIFKPQGDLATECTVTPNRTQFGAIGGGAINPNGTWTLRIFDDANADEGVLVDWDISFDGPAVLASPSTRNFIPIFSGDSLARSALYQRPDSGYVGLGTLAPTSALHVAGRDSNVLTLANSSPYSPAGEKTFLDFKTGDRYTARISASPASGTAGGLSFYTGAATNPAVLGERMSIAANGAVKIASTVAIAGGAPAAGKVLTATDAAGSAVWSAPAPVGTAFKVVNGTSRAFSIDNPTVLDSLYSIYDDGAAFDETSGEYTAPASGTYSFTAVLRGVVIVAAGKPEEFYLSYLVNGVAKELHSFLWQPYPSIPGLRLIVVNSTVQLRLLAGDKVKLSLDSDAGAGATFSMTGNINPGLGPGAIISGYRIF